MHLRLLRSMTINKLEGARIAQSETADIRPPQLLRNNTFPIPSQDNLDWEELIQHAQLGNREALGKLIAQVYDYLLLMTEHSLGGDVKAKFGASDVVQQSLLEAHQAISDFQGTSESEIRAWLKKIVLNNLFDATDQYRNTQSRNVALEVPLNDQQPIAGVGESKRGSTQEEIASQRFRDRHDWQTPSWHINRKEVDEQLMRAVDRLPSRQRYVVEMRHRFGYSLQEIADEMQTSAAAVQKLWSRSVVHLQEWLGNEPT